MVMMNLFRVKGGKNYPPSAPDPVPPPPGTLARPDSAYIGVSDFVAIQQRDGNMLRFIRPDGGNTFQYCQPGARVRVRTDATEVTFTLFANGLCTSGSRNFQATILVDGAEQVTFATGAGGAGTVVRTITLPSAIDRDIDLIWPYGDSVDLVSIAINSGASFKLPTSRPSGKIVTYCDSITHGFLASKTINTWTYKLAGLQGRQIVNLGYGSRRVQAADGFFLNGIAADRVVALLAYNNFNDQQATSTFQSVVEGWIANAMSAIPSAKFYIASQLFTTTSKAIPASSYRTAVQNAVDAIASPNVIYVDGLSLMTNNANRLVDGIHPNDTGHDEVASNFNGVIGI